MTSQIALKYKSILFMMLLCYSTQAQVNCDWTKKRGNTEHLLKTNLLTLPLKNYNLEYERTITNRITAGVSVNYIPKRNLPFKDIIIEFVEEENAVKTLRDATMEYFSIVPQARFYFGDQPTFTKFYFSPYLKYARVTTDFTVHYPEVNIQNVITPIDIPLNGHINMFSIGYAFGVQFNLYKSLFLDWKIFGNHYGISRGRIHGYSEWPISPQAQDRIRKDLESLDDIPLYSFDSYVDANRVEIKPKGAMVGFTSSLSIGYRF